MRTIANAQADARAILVSPDSIIRGELDIAQTITQRNQFQEEKRQRNIGTVVGQAALELGDKDVVDSEPDHDWTARFFNDVQDVSSGRDAIAIGEKCSPARLNDLEYVHSDSKHSKKS